VSVDYTIAAIPTNYRGRRYRSRLEARWAAFFDLLSWGAEYEPYDLGKWSPDFLLSKMETLVEVKPLSSFDPDVWEKAASASEGCGKFYQGLEPELDYELSGLLLTRTAPVIDETGRVQLGWFAVPDQNGFNPQPAYLGWLSSNLTPEREPAIIHTERNGWWSTRGYFGPWSDYLSPRFYAEHTLKLWATATNTVQWLGHAK
jgi:hypothetical protein